MQASIETLSDGSEYVGCALFLTVRKLGTRAPADDDNESGHLDFDTSAGSDEDGKIVARYSLTGLPSLTGRISADQSFKLLQNGAFRAVLLPALKSLGGLPSLFLNLLSSGYRLATAEDDGSWTEDSKPGPQIYDAISVIGPPGTGEKLDGILEIMFGNRRSRPAIRLCNVPDRRGWFEVYSDSYVLIWGRLVRGEAVSVVYLVSLPSAGDTDQQKSCTFAILPEKLASLDAIWDTFRELPHTVVANKNEESHLIDFVIHLNPNIISGTQHLNQGTKRQKTGRTKVASHQVAVPSWIEESRLVRAHLATVSNGRPGESSTRPRILQRARRQALRLNKTLPFAFPFNEQAESSQSASRDDNRKTTALAYQLFPGTSVKFKRCNDTVTGASPFSFVARNNCLKDVDSNEDMGLENPAVEALRCAFLDRPSVCENDENEIELDSDGDVENEDEAKEDIVIPCPRLIVLGTGCAKPSPSRGSSGYGILLPSGDQERPSSLVLSCIIECGEGTLTGLSRHLPPICCRSPGHSTSLDAHLSHVCFLWISHSHLDHYGDVCELVERIAHAKRRSGQRSDGDGRLVVIAPSKVLKMIDLMRQGTNHGGPMKRSYLGVTHREFQSSPFARDIRSSVCNFELRYPGQSTHYRPFTTLCNVEVEHCRDAHAVILEMEVPSSRPNCSLERLTVCFSGDTRPSDNLVGHCRRCTGRISLLIHEATFLHDGHGKSEAKKKNHSTTIEALDIARRIDAGACLLTHFSQRYQHVNYADVSRDTSYAFPWGLAVDGLVLPLNDRSLSSLGDLSNCIDRIIQQSSSV